MNKRTNNTKKLKLRKLIQDLQQLVDQSNIPHADLEDIHIQADELLLNYIGDKEVFSTFTKIGKWYG